MLLAAAKAGALTDCRWPQDADNAPAHRAARAREMIQLHFREWLSLDESRREPRRRVPARARGRHRLREKEQPDRRRRRPAVGRRAADEVDVPRRRPLRRSRPRSRSTTGSARRTPWDATRRTRCRAGRACSTHAGVLTVDGDASASIVLRRPSTSMRKERCCARTCRRRRPARRRSCSRPTRRASGRSRTRASCTSPASTCHGQFDPLAYAFRAVRPRWAACR